MKHISKSRSTSELVSHKNKHDPEEKLLSLSNSVIFYKYPDKPVGENEWEALRIQPPKV